MKIKDLKARIATWPDDAEVKVKVIKDCDAGNFALMPIDSFGGYTSDWIPENSWLELVCFEPDDE